MTLQLKCSITVRPVSKLLQSELEEAYKLFMITFDDVSYKKFHEYMNKYNHCSFYRVPKTGELAGFSSAGLESYDVAGEKIWVFSNGHTLISHNHRELGGECVTYALGWYISMMWDKIKDKPDNVYYWMMSEGLASYLWLKNTFPTFYPRHDMVTPTREQSSTI
jgi:hypothetical protein